MKNKKFSRIISCVLITALLACCFASCSNGGSDDAEATPTPNASSTPVSAAPVSHNPDAVNSKSETVYVITDASGAVKKLIVSDWLKNANGSASLADVSNLTDIENVKGRETFTSDGGALVWDAEGSDIYYQGSSDAELPVQVTVSYTLDGEEISASELEGKSGHVTIRLDYTNTTSVPADIDGKTENVCVPFVMLSGMLLDNESFRNIEVSNGRLVNDGDHSVAIGLALPGLQDTLGLEDTELPDHVEFSADVSSFELPDIMTVATSEVFAVVDTAELEGTDDLSDSLSQLSTAMDALLDGSSQLYDGLSTLLEKSGELVSGIDALAAGSAALADGAGSLESGAAQLQKGLASLSSGLGELSANNASLTAGAKAVFETLLDTVEAQVKSAGLDIPELTIDNYATVLGSLAQSVSPENVQATAEAAARKTVTEKVTTAVRESVLDAVLGAKGLTRDAYAALDAETKAAIDAAVDAQLASDSVKAQISALVDQNMASSEVQAQIKAAVEAASSGAGSLGTAKAQLDSYNTFYQGLLTYTSGVASASSGSQQLLSGSAQLAQGAKAVNSGAGELKAGLGTLQDGAGTLIEGVTQLRDGSMTLSDGLQRFYDEGISKILELADGDTLARLKAVIDAAADYNSFSGVSSDMTGSVSFIFKTSAD